MALSMDRSLPSSMTSGLRQQPAQSRAPRMDDRRVGDMVNNQMARLGGREQAMQDMDRAGVSRGRGQAYRADLAGAMQGVANRADADRTEMGAGQANAQAQLSYDSMRSNERNANAGLLEGLRESQAAERNARMARGLDTYEAYRQGALGLDRMQLDYTPLLRSLLQ